jgi:hypothetical protein
MKNKIIVAAIALVGVFLVGFVPQYIRANRLKKMNYASPERRSREPSFGI